MISRVAGAGAPIAASPLTPQRASPFDIVYPPPRTPNLPATAGLYAFRADPGTAAFPLALISPAIPSMVSSTFGQLRKGRVPLELSPDDAAARGIAHGDLVRVWNELGEVLSLIHISEPTRPY